MTTPTEQDAAVQDMPPIDTSKMSEGKRQALELTESARESTQSQSFALS